MTENELDELLNVWVVPETRQTWRRDLRARLELAAPKTRLRSRSLRLWPWFARAAGTAGAAVICLVIITQAYPQVFRFAHPATPVPYVAETRFARYDARGAVVEEMTTTSYAETGYDLVVEVRSPGVPGLIRKTNIGLRMLIYRFFPGLFVNEQSRHWLERFVASGCQAGGAKLIGRELLLGYQTNMIQATEPNGARFTSWYAPELGCFCLKSRSELPIPGGGYRLDESRETTAVTMGCRIRNAEGVCTERYTKFPFN